jgi:uncharacterized protein (DUF1501 family)
MKKPLEPTSSPAPRDDGRATPSMLATPEDAARLSRRSFLSTGVSVTAWASLAKLLGGTAMAADETFRPVRKLIWIDMDGGWDILEVTDPKAQSTAKLDAIYDFGAAPLVAGAADGTRIGRFLPKIAGIGGDLLVVRGLAMGTTSHMAGSVYMDTAVLSNTGRVNAASIPAIVASQSTATIPINQLAGGANPMTDRGLLNPVSTVRAGDLELYRSMFPASDSAFAVKDRTLDYLKGSLARLKDEIGASDRIAALEAAQDKVRAQFAAKIGEKLAVSAADRAAFLSGAPDGMNQGAVDPAALALKLISSDICTAVNIGFGGFDTHSGQTQRLQTLLPTVDHVVRALVDGLRAANKLNETLIVLFSDFGRTPKVNGGNGRDHWPVGGALVIGGGIAGGRAVGATDENLNAANLVDPNTGLATTDAATGVQLNPTHLGGMVLALTLGEGYLKYRPYLTALPAMTRLAGGG